MTMTPQRTTVFALLSLCYGTVSSGRIVGELQSPNKLRSQSQPVPKQSRTRQLAQYPPSSDLWCSILNFCVEPEDVDNDITIPTATPVTAPAPIAAPISAPVTVVEELTIAPTGPPVVSETMTALCEFMSLCDWSPTPAPQDTATSEEAEAPVPSPDLNQTTPAPTAQKDATSLLDLCVFMGLCNVTDTVVPDGFTATPTAIPQTTNAPTAVPNPEDNTQAEEFDFEDGDQKATAEPTIATERPTHTTKAPATTHQEEEELEETDAIQTTNNNPVDGFLCNILGICGNAPEDGEVVLTIVPTAAPIETESKATDSDRENDTASTPEPTTSKPTRVPTPVPTLSPTLRPTTVAPTPQPTRATLLCSLTRLC